MRYPPARSRTPRRLPLPRIATSRLPDPVTEADSCACDRRLSRVERRIVRSAACGSTSSGTCFLSEGPFGDVYVGSPHAPRLNSATWNGVRVSTWVSLLESTYQPTAVPGGSAAGDRAGMGWKTFPSVE